MVMQAGPLVNVRIVVVFTLEGGNKKTPQDKVLRGRRFVATCEGRLKSFEPVGSIHSNPWPGFRAVASLNLWPLFLFPRRADSGKCRLIL